MNPATLSAVSVGGRSFACGLAEDGTEIGHIIDSHTYSYISDRIAGLSEKLLCHGDTDLKYILRSGVARDGLDFPVELGLTDTEYRGEFVIIHLTLDDEVVNH